MAILSAIHNVEYPSRGEMAVMVAALSLVYVVARGIYFSFYHPYAKYPGPRLAAVSNLWYAYHWFSGRYPWAIEKAVEEYGDVVRIAPNEIVFMRPEAQTDILMSGTGKKNATFIKTDFQHIGGEHAGIAADPDIEKHRAVRKLLAPAFNPRALKEQEPALHDHIDGFIAQLRRYGTSQGVDMREWFDWLACDIAGDMGYGHHFHNVRDTRAHLFLRTFRGIGFWGTLNQVMKRFPLIYPLVFLALPPKMAAVLPTLLRSNLQIVRDRVKNRDHLPHPDYFSLLVTPDGPIPSDAFLVAQANHLIVGGFDPDTNLFTAAMHYLLENPTTYELLKAEIRSRFHSASDLQNDALATLPYLHAVIEETLRLHTNGAFGLPRISPGGEVDGHYIPKGTATFAVTHSERYFVRARAFHPERWLPPSHSAYDAQFDADVRSAFKPFSMGPRGCIGQNMGYMQARILFSKMIFHFDWELLNRGEVDWERDLKLFAIWEKPPVVVKYTPVAHAAA